MLRYNFSGHPVAGFEISPLIGVEFAHESQSLQQQLRGLLADLPHRDQLLEGAIPEIVLPGLAQATALILAEWHGQFGNFPKVRWSVRTDEGFEYPDTATADLNEIRSDARLHRTS